MGQKGIYRRGDAQWQVKIRRGRQSVSRTFDTYNDALTWRNVTVGHIDGHEYVDKSRERRSTLTHLLERYEREITPTKKGAQQERYRIKQWKAEPFATWALPAVESKTIADWIAQKQAQGAAPSTISNAVNLLSAVFKIARGAWGYKVVNPCTQVPRPKARPPRTARLTSEQEKQLLTACREGPPWLEWCTKLAIETAMRASEIRHLRWEHIHETHIHLPKTKNGEARDVPLTLAALTVIKNMRKKLSRRTDGWVFGDPTIEGKDPGRFTKDMLSQAYRDAAQSVGVELTFHDLRHVATTRLADLHENVLELAATTGHKTLNVLKRYYNPDPGKRAAQLREREAARHAKRRTAPA